MLEYLIQATNMFLSFIFYCFLMSVLVYNWEKFQKSKIWYLIFTVIVAMVLVLSILNNNLVGAILILFLLWGYFYYSTINNQIIKMSIDKMQLIIWNKAYPRNSFAWYVVEIYPTTQRIKNIVFLTPKTHLIYTFDDSLDHIGSFLDELDWYLPRVGDYHQTSIEKLSRKMKL